VRGAKCKRGAEKNFFFCWVGGTPPSPWPPGNKNRWTKKNPERKEDLKPKSRNSLGVRSSTNQERSPELKDANVLSRQKVGGKKGKTIVPSAQNKSVGRRGGRLKVGNGARRSNRGS